MANLKVNSTAVRDAASQIKTKVTELDSKISEMDNICAKISESWVGSASTSYIEKVQQKKKELANIVDELAKLPTTFNNIAGKMEENEQAITSKLGGSN